jgi:Tfp pilus assembly major pilin PilA
MDETEKLITARVMICLGIIAIVTLAIVLYDEYYLHFYNEVEQTVAGSLAKFHNTVASN